LEDVKVRFDIIAVIVVPTRRSVVAWDFKFEDNIEL
jgi:hypothetical protein